MLITPSDSKYPSSWTSSAIKELFQDDPHQTTLNTTNTTKTTNSSTATLRSTPASQRSHSQLGHGALIGIIVGCITASLLCAVIIIYMIKKKRRNRKKNIETFALSTAILPVTTSDQDSNELSTERAPREIMNQRIDRAELFVPRVATLVEADTA